VSKNGQAKDSKLHQSLSLFDLSSLSISSVGPAFSVSAAAGVMVGYSGIYSLLAIVLIAFPFLISAFVFRVLNQHFPQSGASYHWSLRVLGQKPARFQGWIIILAYFASLPPILLPASQYTIALIHPQWVSNPWIQLVVSTFWILVAMTVLLTGAKPTARVTQVFLVVELVFLVVFVAYGIWMLPHAHFPVWHGKFPWSGIMLTMVVASTILDGWEIDSYATEESSNPKVDPGVGGILGAIFALVVYAILFPLVIGETPYHLLVNSPNPMVLWAKNLIPSLGVWGPKLILIPIIASTAGSLWLTAYILIRGLYAMGRDKLIPSSFGSLNKYKSPAFATIVVFAAVWFILILQLFASSLASFFTVVLSAAGFFLTLEFTLDNITAMVFLFKLHHNSHSDVSGHSHFWMKIGTVFTTIYLTGLLIGFLYYSPKFISPWFDWVILGLCLLGVVFVLYPRRSATQAHIFQMDADSSLSQASGQPL